MAVNDSRSMDTLLSLTADHYYKSGLVHDAIFKSNPTFAELNKKGIKKMVDGGARIQVNLMYGKNATVDSYSRYGLIDTAPQDGIEPAIYQWAQYAGTISIDGLQEAQNRGKSEIQKILREKVTQLTMSFSEKMNADLWDLSGYTVANATTGNGGKNINSIPLFVQGDPTATSTVGGIDQATNSWWQNKTKNATDAGTFLNLQQELRTLYNNCSKGYGGAPDMIIVDQTTFENYETGMDTKTRYEYTDTASVGFENIKFKGAKMFWDEHVPDPEAGVNWDGVVTDGAAYMLNTKCLDLICLKGKDFAPLGFDRPTNQDARTGMWVFYGQLVCSNRRKLGVLEDIDLTITA